VQDSVDALPRRELCESVDDEVGGAATVESWVVVHGRDGSPERVLAATLLDDGRRAWAFSDDDATVAEMRAGAEQIGRSVKVDADGHLHL
jgi:acetyl-CoA C-acetyltransferase